ncbi:MAG: hypothetical protein QM599_11630 [Pseudoxanthomonas sp.]
MTVVLGALGISAASALEGHCLRAAPVTATITLFICATGLLLPAIFYFLLLPP